MAGSKCNEFGKAMHTVAILRFVKIISTFFLNNPTKPQACDFPMNNAAPHVVILPSRVLFREYPVNARRTQA
jgi:hypothetical protein